MEKKRKSPQESSDRKAGPLIARTTRARCISRWLALAAKTQATALGCRFRFVGKRPLTPSTLGSERVKNRSRDVGRRVAFNRLSGSFRQRSKRPRQQPFALLKPTLEVIQSLPSLLVLLSGHLREQRFHILNPLQRAFYTRGKPLLDDDRGEFAQLEIRGKMTLPRARKIHSLDGSNAP